MKTRLVPVLFMLSMLEGAAIAFAGHIDCSDPPGPPGRITCEDDSDTPMCEAKKKRIEGQCLKSKSANKKDREKLVLGKALGRTPSDAELQLYALQLAAGRIKIGESVFTFPPIHDNHIRIEPFPRNGVGKPVPTPGRISCTGCIAVAGQRVCETASAISEEEVRQKILLKIKSRFIGKNQPILVDPRNISWDCE